MGLRGMNLVLNLWSRLQRLARWEEGVGGMMTKKRSTTQKKLATVASRGTEEEVSNTVPRHIYGAPQL